MISAPGNQSGPLTPNGNSNLEGQLPTISKQPSPTLLVLSSTYPRWENDHEPSFVHELASRLTKHFTVHVLAPHADGALTSEVMSEVIVTRYRYAPQGLETLVNNGGIVNNLRRNPWKILLVPFFLASMTWHAYRLVTRLKPNVIHAHWIIPQGTALSLLSLTGMQLPAILLTSHGADMYSMRSWLMTRIKQWTISKTSLITVVSNAMTDDARRLGASNILVEPMGVNLSTLFVPPSHNTRSQNSILFVGRLVPKKGLSVLIDAMLEIKASQPHAVLTVIGHGPELASLKARAKELDLLSCIEFVGPKSQSELPEYYQSAAVFVAPFIQTKDGDQEGLGLVVVEALGCACPVVVSDLPQVKQTIDAGITAKIVPPNCPSSLAKAVLQQLSTPYDKATHLENAENIRARFDWDTIASRYASVLMELAQ